MDRRAFLVACVRTAASAALAAACAGGPAAPATADNAAIRGDFERHVDTVQVTAAGTVDRLLSDQGGPSGLHQRFILRLTGVSLTVLIEHNLTIAPRVPVVDGAPVTVHGEYVWNDQGGLIHFTHHDPQGSHDAGYILYGGKRYD